MDVNYYLSKLQEGYYDSHPFAKSGKGLVLHPKSGRIRDGHIILYSSGGIHQTGKKDFLNPTLPGRIEDLHGDWETYSSTQTYQCGYLTFRDVESFKEAVSVLEEKGKKFGKEIVIECFNGIIISVCTEKTLWEKNMERIKYKERVFPYIKTMQEGSCLYVRFSSKSSIVIKVGSMFSNMLQKSMDELCSFLKGVNYDWVPVKVVGRLYC